MVHAIASQGFDADIKAVNNDSVVVLHRWSDCMLLVLTFDDEMPAFTAKLIEPGSASREIKGKDAVTAATGYVFHLTEPDVNGPLEFEGIRYAYIDVEDYVVWTDEAEVRRKYAEVLAEARAE